MGKTHYELLGVAADAPAEEIKHAFRREIAKYHPDKVQHLGQEFQDIAAGLLSGSDGDVLQYGPTRGFGRLIEATVGVLAARGIRHSRTGRALIALRENENAAQSYGINVVRTTLAGFAISGFMAAVAGVLYVHEQNGLTATAFEIGRAHV